MTPETTSSAVSAACGTFAPTRAPVAPAAPFGAAPARRFGGSNRFRGMRSPLVDGLALQLALEVSYLNELADGVYRNPAAATGAERRVARYVRQNCLGLDALVRRSWAVSGQGGIYRMLMWDFWDGDDPELVVGHLLQRVCADLLAEKGPWAMGAHPLQQQYLADRLPVADGEGERFADGRVPEEAEEAEEVVEVGRGWTGLKQLSRLSRCTLRLLRKAADTRRFNPANSADHWKRAERRTGGLLTPFFVGALVRAYTRAHLLAEGVGPARRAVLQRRQQRELRKLYGKIAWAAALLAVPRPPGAPLRLPNP